MCWMVSGSNGPSCMCSPTYICFYCTNDYLNQKKMSYFKNNRHLEEKLFFFFCGVINFHLAIKLNHKLYLQFFFCLILFNVSSLLKQQDQYYCCPYANIYLFYEIFQLFGYCQSYAASINV